MSPPDPVAAAEDGRALLDLNRWLERQRAEDRVAWALASGADNHAVSSSFGAQSAVTLHLLSQARPDIPVILVDTGYLFAETYQFIDRLVDRLKLNL
jgi:phosphoadenosine phosphosulfate reductase